MTNSTNSPYGIKGNEALEAMLSEVKGRYNVTNVDIVVENQVSLDMENGDVHSILTYLRNTGWRQLSMLTCVDWIADGQFQLVYILMNWENGVRIQVRTRIDRNDPKFLTVTNIYPGAKYYERDVHEFFGVVFEGENNILFKKVQLGVYEELKMA